MTRPKILRNFRSARAASVLGFVEIEPVLEKRRNSSLLVSIRRRKNAAYWPMGNMLVSSLPQTRQIGSLTTSPPLQFHLILSYRFRFSLQVRFRSSYQTKPYPPGYSNLNSGRDTLELLSIVRTLPNAPDAFHGFSFAGGFCYCSLRRNEPERQGSQESLNQRPPLLA